MRDGLFTGKKLADYITPASTDYLHARQIINRMDRAQDIANYAVKIQAALQSAA
jgi:putative chitinase